MQNRSRSVKTSANMPEKYVRQYAQQRRFRYHDDHGFRPQTYIRFTLVGSSKICSIASKGTKDTVFQKMRSKPSDRIAF